MKPSQMTFDFQPGLTVQFKTLTEVCAAAVYGSRGGLSAVAADLDISPSDLSRRLTPSQHGSDNRPLTAEQVDGIVSSTKDMRPIFWQMEKHMQDPEAKKNQAIEQLAAALPMVLALIEQAGGPKLRSAA
jgi:hypothetical protein